MRERGIKDDILVLASVINNGRWLSFPELGKRVKKISVIEFSFGHVKFEMRFREVPMRC